MEYRRLSCPSSHGSGSGRRWRRWPPASRSGPLRRACGPFGRPPAGSACQSALLRDELSTGRALLLRLLRKDRRRLGDLGPCRGRVHARDPHLVLEALDRLRNLLVLRADRVEVVDLVEEIGKGPHLEEDLEL